MRNAATNEAPAAPGATAEDRTAGEGGYAFKGLSTCVGPISAWFLVDLERLSVQLSLQLAPGRFPQREASRRAFCLGLSTEFQSCSKHDRNGRHDRNDGKRQPGLRDQFAFDTCVVGHGNPPMPVKRSRAPRSLDQLYGWISRSPELSTGYGSSGPHHLRGFGCIS